MFPPLPLVNWNVTNSSASHTKNEYEEPRNGIFHFKTFIVCSFFRRGLIQSPVSITSGGYLPVTHR
ncbi:hypothetical protein FQZ97_757200 [compost metagenome]